MLLEDKWQMNANSFVGANLVQIFIMCVCMFKHTSKIVEARNLEINEDFIVENSY